eukprot:m.46895 g.46895  ORF g.46895 m.46895 type:complete len:55 (-) comp47469_c0_seq5:151-315(-)
MAVVTGRLAVVLLDCLLLVVEVFFLCSWLLSRDFESIFYFWMVDFAVLMSYFRC